MPRNGSGVYSPATGTATVSPNTVIESDVWNDFVADLTSVLNSAVPVAYGGTGYTSEAALKTALGVLEQEEIIDFIGAMVTGNTETGIDVTFDDANDIFNFALTADQRTASITFVMENGGQVLETGIQGDLVIPFACTIQKVVALADQSGSAEVDIWKDTYANFPPTNSDSITASAEVDINSSNKYEDATLTGWTTAIAKDDILRFNLDSVSDIERLTIHLEVLKTS